MATTFFIILFLIGVVLFIYSYAGYSLLLRLLKRLFFPSERIASSAHPGSGRDLPSVTILIPAYNEEKIIHKKIDNALALNYPREKLDILVCSDASSDRTAEIVSNIDNPCVRFIEYTQRRGKTGVINASIPQARGDIVVLTDANTMFALDAVMTMAGGYTSADIGAVCGHVRLIPPRNAQKVDKEIAYRESEAYMKYVEGLFGAAIGAFGGFYSIRKSLFTPLAPNAFSNDDFLIPMHILSKGYRVIFLPNAVATEDTGKSIGNEFSRRVRIGAGNFQSFTFLPGMLNPLKGKRFFFYFSHKLLRWFSPFLLLLMLISNIAVHHIPVFFYLLAAQIGLYAASGFGFILSKINIFPPFLTPAYHFVSMNIALLLGFFKRMQGIKSGTWESTERNES